MITTTRSVCCMALRTAASKASGLRNERGEGRRRHAAAGYKNQVRECEGQQRLRAIRECVAKREA